MRGLVTGVGLALIAFAVSDISRGGETQGETMAKSPEPYAPGLGDFMTAYVQPHHIKLWQAGSVGNWPLAAYEANELRETFEDVTTYQGVWHDLPIGKMVDGLLKPKLASVDQAITKQDAAAFGKGFDELTEACNQCHRAARHDFIVIRVPSGSAFPDQTFAPR
ncbi:MAG TPA: hypothetical protein VKZ79_22590 [Alphaproteobacteria bacterium]|nr:hypothetical protein [Alphaproteobacteria bacterium]